MVNFGYHPLVVFPNMSFFRFPEKLLYAYCRYLGAWRFLKSCQPDLKQMVLCKVNTCHYLTQLCEMLFYYGDISLSDESCQFGAEVQLFGDISCLQYQGIILLLLVAVKASILILFAIPFS
jgi:hypothetical protein